MLIPKIAIFVEDLGGGGAEKIAVLQANGFVRMGLSVDFIMRHAEGPYLDKLHPLVNKVVLCGGKQAPSVLATVAALKEYFLQNPNTPIFTHLEKPSLFALLAARLAGYRRVIPCVHTDLEVYATLEHSFRRKILVWFVSKLYQSAACVATVSEGASISMRAILGRDAPLVSTVYNGFDLAELKEQAQQPVQLAALHDKAEPVLITCGRMVPQKGHDVLLRAFAALRRQRPARLVMLGQGPEQESLERLAQELAITPYVTFAGFVNNPVACIAAADLFVLTSRVEGFANVLVEALIANTPIVSTDCPVGPEEVLRDGAFGTLVAVDDVDALTSAMLEMLDKPVMPDPAALELHLEQFSLQGMCDAYLSLAVHAGLRLPDEIKAMPKQTADENVAYEHI